MSNNKKIRLEKKPESQEHKIETVNEIEEREMKRAVRITMVTCALVFALLLSMGVGAYLALWDMEKKPADLMAAISGKDVAGGTDSGLTFIDADGSTGSDEGTSGSGLTFYDADDSSNVADTGLTFIDPNEDTSLTFIDPDEDDADGSGDSTAGKITDTSDTAANSSDGQADSSDSSDKKQAGDMLDDGSLVVSSELAGVSSIVRAGSEEAMRVTSMSHANVVNPDSLYPLPFQKVDESYFEDALFIGDSRLQGFGMWSGLPGTYYCATGFQLYDYKTKKVVQTGNGKVPIFDAIPYNAFTKIYIKVGINEMGWGTEAGFEEVYAQLIADLRAVEPRAIIYVHAVLPVTAAKSASDRSHNNPNIIARNTALEQFAKDQRCYFIDAGPAVSDENGCLKPETTSDGIHLSSKSMGAWKQFLLDNAVVVPAE